MGSRRDLAFILFLRGKSIPTQGTATYLKELVGEISETERAYLKYYLDFVKWNTQYNEYYSQFAKTELANLLKYKTGLNFPLPLTFLGTHYISELLGFYSAFRSIIAPISMPQLNEEQQRILTATGLSVVNSGPGTGKTTTLIAKGLAHAEEGVILVSYTNASVNEIYDRIMTYPGSSKLVTKTFGKKKIWCTTIDKIASLILGGTLGKGSEEDEDTEVVTYDDGIQLAASELENRRSLFYEAGIGLRYKHILIDEAQDIDEIRYQLVLNLYRQLKMKSLTAFGDPRQRILLNRGRWYGDLWVSDKVTKYAIGTTYRFSGELLDLANKLSLRREELHVQLRSPLMTTTSLKGVVAATDDAIAAIGRELLELQKQGNSWRDFVFITPSLNSNNATSTYSMRVMAVLRSLDIPCYSREEGNFRANAVFFSTIPGIKGREYKYVYLMGLDDFPMSFPHIEYDVAQSMIFVANTRAKKAITYIFRRQMAFPEGVTETALTEWKSRQPLGRDKKIFGLTNEIINDINFYTFLETNGIRFIVDTQYPLGLALPPAPDGLSKRFWGIVCHLMMAIYLSEDYPKILYDLASSKVLYLSSEEIRRLRGALDRGKYSGDDDYEAGTIILNSSINSVQESELEQLREILKKPYRELSSREILHLALIYDIIISTHALARYDERLDEAIFDLKEPLKRFSNFLRQFLEDNIEVEVSAQLKEVCMGVVDVTSKRFAVEFKTGEIGQKELAQAYIYGLMTNKIPLLINLVKGELIIVKSEGGPDFASYLIEGFTQLKLHQMIVEERVSNFKRRQVGTLPQHQPNTFLVDTEFTISGNEIFDIALININNIYQSIIQCCDIKGNVMEAVQWLHRPRGAFYYPLDRVKKLLMNITSKEPDYDPTFIYYHCAVDVSWVPFNSRTIDIANKAREIGARLGYYQLNGSPPRCSEIYQVVAAPLELRSYLQVHTALSDALMLYEMERTGWQT